MGNRAVIAFSTQEETPAIYLHWNGGRASVEAFLNAARALGLRHVGPNRDERTRAMDWLANTVARTFFGHDPGFTIYRQRYGESDRDNWDNGTYILASDLSIELRLHKRGADEFNAEKTAAITEQILSRAAIFND